MGPGNQENLTMAAEESGKTVPVHIYLYNHYSDPWGYNFTTSAELQELIDSLPANIDVKGVMVRESRRGGMAVGLIDLEGGMQCSPCSAPAALPAHHIPTLCAADAATCCC
jgi:hypothetical protein